METVTPENDTLTSPSENVDYTFYFEINKKNFQSICSVNKHFVEFKGYEWENIWNRNKSCNNCPDNGIKNYPIKNTLKKNQKVPIGEGGITIPKNCFLLTDSIKLTDIVKISCSTFISTEGCLSYIDTNLCIDNIETTPMEEDTMEPFEDMDTTPPEIKNIKILDNETKVFEQEISCTGEKCLNFFPPSEVTYENNYIYRPEKNENKIIDCNSNHLNFSQGYPACFDNNGNPVEICYEGTPTFTYFIYKPLNFSKLPTLNSQKKYVPPTLPIQAGFYNLYPFTTELELVQTYTEKGNNLPNGTFAVYKVEYSFNPNLFENQENKLKDFLNLQKNLDSTFSSWFKKTTLYEISNRSQKKIISDFCYYTSDNKSSLCNENIESFTYNPTFFSKNQIILLIITFFLFLIFFFKS